MKIIALILALLIQVVTCIPCGDAIECNNVSVNTVANENQKHQHDTHNHEVETCSPFCACGCCATIAGFLIFDAVNVEFATKLEVQPQYLIGAFQFISFEDQSIWQPPQLV